MASCGSVTKACSFFRRGSVRWAFAPSSPPAAYRRGGCGCACQPPARWLLQNGNEPFAPQRHAAIAALPAYRRVGTAVAPKGALVCLSSPTHHPNLIPIIYHRHHHDPAPTDVAAGFWCLARCRARAPVPVPTGSVFALWRRAAATGFLTKIHRQTGIFYL